MKKKVIIIKQPQQMRSKRKFAAILAASTRVLAEKGFNKTTTADIALEADVSIGSLYDYFSNKEAILIAYLDTQLRQALDTAHQLSLSQHLDSKAVVKAFLTVGIEFAMTEKNALQTLFLHMPQCIEKMPLTNSQALIVQIAQQFVATQWRHAPPSPRQLELTLYSITNAILGFQFRIAVIQDNPFTKEELVEQLYALVGHQLLPAAEVKRR